MPRHARGFDTEQAWDHLSRRDRKLGTWMKRIGYIEPQPTWRKPFDPVDALARGEKWGPYRTYAAQYLWRIADFGTDAKTATKRSQD